MASSRILLVVVLGLTALLGGCRVGDTTACTDRVVRDCQDPGDIDAVALAFESRGYDTCREAVEDSSCGLDAEALRRCVDRLQTPLCVPPEYQSVDVTTLFETTDCTQELETFLDCEDDQSSSHSSYGSHSRYGDYDD